MNPGSLWDARKARRRHAAELHVAVEKASGRASGRMLGEAVCVQCFILGLGSLTVLSSAPSMESGKHADALMPRGCVHTFLISRADHTLWLSNLSQ